MKQLSIFAGIFLLHQLILTFLYVELFPIHFSPKSLFFPDLIGRNMFIPYQLLLLFETGNLILLWLIGRRIFGKYPFLLPLIYTVSPWSSYLLVGESLYILLLFLLLVGFWGLLLIKTRRILATILMSVAILGLGYSSLSLLILLPFIFLLPIFKVITFKDVKFAFAIIIILIFPLLFLIQKNTIGFTNILNNEVKVFSDPGILNMINNYQGAAQKIGLGNLAKISENKYLFTIENILIKYTKQLVPSTYFTSQEKLLNFSFTPPIFIGFLIPFLFGLYSLLHSPFLRKAIFLSSILVVPSVLSGQKVDLNRLIIFAPVVMIVISFGIIELIKTKKKIHYPFLVLTLILIIFQSLVVISDIDLREKARFSKFYEFERNFEVGKQ